MKKQYTPAQVHDAMKRLLDVDFKMKTIVLNTEVFLYSTKTEGFNMAVRISDGTFFGVETGSDQWQAPIGAIQSIKGM